MASRLLHNLCHNEPKSPATFVLDGRLPRAQIMLVYGAEGQGCGPTAYYVMKGFAESNVTQNDAADKSVHEELHPEHVAHV